MVAAADWEVVRLGDFADVRTGPFGSALHASDYVPTGTPIITVEHLGRFRLEGDDAPMVADKDRDRLSRYILRDGDIVFSRVGSIGRFGLVTELEEGWLFSGRLLRVRLEHGCAPFVYHQMCTTGFIRQIESVAVGQTMPSLNTVIVNDLRILLPSLREQRAIAEALSDADALVESLDALIAKKRDMKQAAMQQLLTGRTRLPGFMEDWRTVTLSECAERIYGGGTPSRGEPRYWGGTIPWVTVKDLGAHDGRGTQEYISEQGLLSSSAQLVPPGQVIVCTRMAPGRAVAYEVEVAINQDMKALIAKSDVHPPFLLRAINSRTEELATISSGSTVAGLSVSDLRSVLMGLPSFNEQQAIAEVLSDMDAEIDALVAQREKAELVKQGMMQELLSGRVRLA